MNQETINLRDRQIELALVNISTTLSDATALMEKIKEMIALSESKLIEAQLELENLYIILKEEPFPYLERSLV